MPRVRKGRRQFDDLGDLGPGVSLVDVPERLIVEVGIKVPLG
ncbi:hypothetical protein [Arthrobacter sp. ok909]|nr:hypothetical protein [Arthrobacter sp. ok909]